MGKLTVQQIDERVLRTLASLQRALQRKEISPAQLDQCARDLAYWAVEEYSKLPGRTEAVEAILRLNDRLQEVK